MNAPAANELGAPLRIGAEQVARARLLAGERGLRLVDALEEESGLDADAFGVALAGLLGRRLLSMADLQRLSPAFELLPFADAQARDCVLLRDGGGALTIACGDPFDAGLRAWLEELVRLPVQWAVAHRADIAACLAQHETSMRAMDGMLPQTQETGTGAGRADDLSLRSISADTSPVVKLVHSTLYDALKSGASDIHLETGVESLSIKYRIDGVLTQVANAAGLDTADQVISRIKVMSELDIAERRVPQDGRFKVSVGGREIDFRVSIMPSTLGEDAVLRILDKRALSDEMRGLRLDYLGFAADVMVVLRRLSAEPYGMLLVTGPTGSGKTTSLYAAISEINHGRDKIVTIEDPVEYQLPGVLQIPVNEKKGLTFARGLRSILRHDPDKIMVGEIRDPETAQIAVQAALTGHLVFTTVHANNVLDVLGRFTHMGIDPYSFVSALNGIVAQRLLRVNCTHCAAAFVPSAELLAASGMTAEGVRGFEFRAGRGCGHCRGTGFKGRRAIAELLVFNDELRELIAERAPVRRIKEAAQRSGTRFLREAAVDLVRDGVTTLEEINRVTLVA
ncbi:MAG: GspE/PulE family protein [Betaproteobacteria bacterium]